MSTEFHAMPETVPPLHHSDSGLPSAATLLLVHPMGADLLFWDACRAVWESQFRCIAVDLRGAGKSPSTQGSVSIRAHGEDVGNLVTQLQAGPVVAVGCAVGAMVATAFAGLHPESCRGLVLSNPGFRTLASARDMLTKRADAVRRAGMMAVLPGALDGAFAGCPHDASRDAFAARFTAQDPLRYALQIEGMLEADTSPFLSAIACPTLIVAGGRDNLLPPSHAAEIHARLPGSCLELMPDGAHFIPYQQPDVFARMVSYFIASLPAPLAGGGD